MILTAVNIPKVKELLRRQTCLTLQQRLAQLKRAKIDIVIPGFGGIEGAPIVTVTKSVISTGGNVLSPAGLILSIMTKPKNPTKSIYTIVLTSKAPPGIPSVGTFLINRKVDQIGLDFIETTLGGQSIELIPLSKVTLIFPQRKLLPFTKKALRQLNKR